MKKMNTVTIMDFDKFCERKGWVSEKVKGFRVRKTFDLGPTSNIH